MGTVLKRFELGDIWMWRRSVTECSEVPLSNILTTNVASWSSHNPSIWQPYLPPFAPDRSCHSLQGTAHLFFMSPQPSRVLDSDFILAVLYIHGRRRRGRKNSFKSDVNYRLSVVPEAFVQFWRGPSSSFSRGFWYFTFDNVYKVIILHQAVLCARRRERDLIFSLFWCLHFRGRAGNHAIVSQTPR